MAVLQTNKALSIWKGTADQFKGITTKGADTLYFVSGNTGDLTGTVYVGPNKYGTTFRSVTEFPEANKAEVGIVYLGPAGEARYSSGTAWIQVCYPLVKEVTAASTDLEVPSALAVYTYVNNIAVGLGRLLPAVQDINELKAVTGQMDKDLILVESIGLYRFDAQSSDPANDNTIVVGTGSGRWLKMTTSAALSTDTGLDLTGNVLSVKLDTNVFAIDTSGNITMKASYIKDITDTIDKAQTDASQALSDAADAQTTADGKIAKISGAAGGKVATTVSGGELAESAYVIGAGTTAAATADKATTLANQAYVDKAVADLVTGEDLQGVVQDAIQATVSTELSNKMDKVTTGTADNLVALGANGNAKDSGKAVGGATLAASPNATTLATEAAVKAAVDVKIAKISDAAGGKIATTTTDGEVSESDYTVGGDTLGTSEAARANTLATEAAVAAAKEEAINGAKIFWTEGTDA